MTSETSLPSSTAEDVEALARFMGWDEWKPFAGNGNDGWTAGADEDGHPIALLWDEEKRTIKRWNPFVSADADLQVLERVREVWGPVKSGEVWPAWKKWKAFEWALPKCSDYTSGSFARAALAVLGERDGGAGGPSEAARGGGQEVEGCVGRDERMVGRRVRM